MEGGEIMMDARTAKAEAEIRQYVDDHTNWFARMSVSNCVARRTSTVENLVLYRDEVERRRRKKLESRNR